MEKKQTISFEMNNIRVMDAESTHRHRISKIIQSTAIHPNPPSYNTIMDAAGSHEGGYKES
jgi:hypothetical protein